MIVNLKCSIELLKKILIKNFRLLSIVNFIEVYCDEIMFLEATHKL